MGDRTHKDKNQDTLGARAREQVEQGLLPRAKAARSWGGRGSGLPCSLCDTPILATEPEMELEFDGAASARVLRFHLQCQSAWDMARREPAADAWTDISANLPPFDAVVEARLNMGASRSVILGVVRARTPDGAGCWMNATTQAPLPPAWLPVEWRYPADAEPAELLASSTPKRA